MTTEAKGGSRSMRNNPLSFKKSGSYGCWLDGTGKPRRHKPSSIAQPSEESGIVGSRDLHSGWGLILEI